MFVCGEKNVYMWGKNVCMWENQLKGRPEIDVMSPPPSLQETPSWRSCWISKSRLLVLATKSYQYQPLPATSQYLSRPTSELLLPILITEDKWSPTLSSSWWKGRGGRRCLREFLGKTSSWGFFYDEYPGEHMELNDNVKYEPALM